MDGCKVALPPCIDRPTEDFHLPPLECDIRIADQKSDVSNKLLNSLKRAGWVIKVSLHIVEFYEFKKMFKICTFESIYPLYDVPSK